MSKLLDQLAVAPQERTFASLDKKDGEEIGSFEPGKDAPRRLLAGRRLPKPETIFPRYVDPAAAAK